MVETGNAYGETGMSGAADFFGHPPARSCSWDFAQNVLSGNADQSFCEAPYNTVFRFDTPRPDCFEASGKARAFLLVDGAVLMTTPTALVNPDCPAPA